MNRLAQVFADPGERALDDATPPSVERLRDALGRADGADLQRLPFTEGDTTAGSEVELQASVTGCAKTVDLPRFVAQSDFFANIVRRAAVRDTAPRTVHAIERFLQDNREGVWDNSWVRFPKQLLGHAARQGATHPPARQPREAETEAAVSRWHVCSRDGRALPGGAACGLGATPALALGSLQRGACPRESVAGTGHPAAAAAGTHGDTARPAGAQ